MHPIIWILLLVIAVVAVPLLLMIPLTMPLAKKQYRNLLVRESSDKWKRENSCPTDKEYSEMYETACAWGASVADKTRDVSITNDGLKLCGKFTDLGSDRTVLILCGRAEGLYYSYYYADPYYRKGYNVLVVDQRAHGESEGMYSGLGIHEARDAIAWIRYLKEQCHTDSVVLHGICIGAACAVCVASAPDCPKELKGIVTDGLYDSFHHVFKQRMRIMKKPEIPVLYEIEYQIRKHIGVNVRTDTPISMMPRVRVPVLMFHSREDISSLPKYTEPLFRACGSERKRLVWMPVGAHSHVRYRNTEQYDRAVADFLNSI